MAVGTKQRGALASAEACLGISFSILWGNERLRSARAVKLAFAHLAQRVHGATVVVIVWLGRWTASGDSPGGCPRCRSRLLFFRPRQTVVAR